jgi:hypothetical protein
LNKRLLTWFVAAIVYLGPTLSLAQTGTADPALDQTAGSQQAQTVRRLLTIKEALDDKRARVRDLVAQLAEAEEVDREKITAKIADLRETITALTRSFEATAVSGASLRNLNDDPKPQLSWHDELMQIARPLLDSLKEATEKPRRIEELRREIELYQQQQAVTRKALASLAQFERQELPPAIATGLAEIASQWKERNRDIERALTLTSEDLRNLESEDINIVATLTDIAREFFLGRGLTLLIALLTGLGVWLLMRTFRRLVSAYRHGREHSARLRLLLYGYHLLTTLLIALTVLSVFYVRGDLLLLSLSIVALIMLALGIWRYLPGYVHEGRLLLNMGAVREGERVIYRGLPFRIASLNLYSELRNPELEGAIRLPLSELAQLISRGSAGEPWFPSRAGDYLLLADGSFAQVLSQGIEWTQLKVMGSIVQVGSAEFSKQNVRNLSREGFAIAAVFGVDYQHQPISLQQIPRRLHSGLREAFANADFGEDLKDLQVNLKAAAASSLDYLIYANMDGNSAASYFAVERLIQQTCVDICNQEGWVIPFTQVTIHQAEASLAGDKHAN